jgi:(E)-4-hydroxy-3-methylbut-2-enyl-diphosphate synthase
MNRGIKLKIVRKNTKEINIGNVKIGGNNLIAIQSMTTSDTRDAKATIKQILELEKEGCEIVRIAVPDMEAAKSIGEIKNGINIPLVSDIHFDYNLAIEAMQQGIDKLRINPGNIGNEEKVKKVVDMAKSKNIPIRIGVNSGSLEHEILKKYGEVTPDALVESAIYHVRLLEKFDYENIIISIKASNVPFSIETYEKISEQVNYPLHLGITESGTLVGGSVKSAVGIGAILSRGIGDTIRVSLTADPLEEVRLGKAILKSLELREFGVEFISCPTCGRTEIDLINMANEVEKYCKDIKHNIKVAVMGCAVNGPGEAKHADVGIAGGKGQGVLFRKGIILKRLTEEELVPALLLEIEKIVGELDGKC